MVRTAVPVMTALYPNSLGLVVPGDVAVACFSCGRWRDATGVDCHIARALGSSETVSPSYAAPASSPPPPPHPHLLSPAAADLTDLLGVDISISPPLPAPPNLVTTPAASIPPSSSPPVAIESLTGRPPTLDEQDQGDSTCPEPIPSPPRSIFSLSPLSTLLYPLYSQKATQHNK